ncbi:MAG: hypothetical protein J0L82_08660 [Deltaproteobacteria bacterium]|jgi:hypothetical protein|nr:hypothetical protein [Deltaproteobacteria bacterium]
MKIARYFFFVIASLNMVGFAQAEYIRCEPTIADSGRSPAPEIIVDTPSRTISLSAPVNLATLTGLAFQTTDLAAGNYVAEAGLSTESRFTVDVTSQLDYSCNYTGAYLNFETRTNTLSVNIKCDGASSFEVYRQELNCTRY